ncbi:MAG: hypothetical protein Q8P67_13190, partial [archaeon]|nr:hypothetical protein [archaeon]
MGEEAILFQSACWMAPHIQPDPTGAFFANSWRLHPHTYQLVISSPDYGAPPASSRPAAPRKALSSNDLLAASSPAQPPSYSTRIRLKYHDNTDVASCAGEELLPAADSSRYFVIPDCGPGGAGARILYGFALETRALSERLRDVIKHSFPAASSSSSSVRPRHASSLFLGTTMTLDGQSQPAPPPVPPALPSSSSTSSPQPEQHGKLPPPLCLPSPRAGSRSSGPVSPSPFSLSSSATSTPLPLTITKTTAGAGSESPMQRAVLGERFTIADGWYYDPFHDYSQPLPPLEERRKAGIPEPLIVVDKRSDKRLANIFNHALNLIKKFPTTDSKARLVSMVACSFMGGSDLFDRGAAKRQEAARFLDEYCAAHREKVVPLGSILIGNECHRAILFKYLCANLSPQLPCKLVIRSIHSAAVFMPVSHHPGRYKQVDMFSPGRLLAQRPSSFSGTDPASLVSRLQPASVSSSTSSLKVPSPEPDPSSEEAEWSRDSTLEHDYRRLLNLPDLQLSKLVLLEPLGSGSFGSVYRCSLGPLQMAVKRVGKQHTDQHGNEDEKKTASLVRSLINESSLLVGLNHPNVVRCLGY